MQRSEISREGFVLFRRQALVAKDDHQMIEQRRPDRRDDIGIQWRRKVHAVDLGAQGASNRSDFHRAFLRVSATKAAKSRPFAA
jgi:hypothetical protein